MIYLILIYFIIVLFIGFKTKEYTNKLDFLYAGRRLTTIPLLMTLVTTWYGAISAVGQAISFSGISAWLYLGATYYVAAYIYSEFISDKIIEYEISSILSGILKYMGKNSAIIAIPIVLLYISPAPYLIILGNLINTIFFNSKEFSISVIISVVVSTLYCFKGGFKSIVNTDKFQFVLMFSGFATLVFYIIFFYDYGFKQMGIIYDKNPELFSMPSKEQWAYITAWGFLAMLTFIDPNFHQRTFSSRSKQEIKKAIKLSIIFWFIFDMMTLFCGLYAINLDSNTPYISLAEVVFIDSPILYGFFIISILSILMSTIDSFTFISAITIGKDLRETFNKPYNQTHIKWGIFISIFLSLIIILFFDNSRVVDIWFTFGSYMASGLLVPFLCIISNRKINNPVIFIFAPVAITFIWDCLNYELAIYPGIFLSLLLGLLLTKRQR